MTDNEKSQLIAEAENVEAIRDFFNEWWTVAELSETASKAYATIINLAARYKMSHDELKELDSLIQQHNIMIDLIKPFARKEGEV